MCVWACFTKNNYRLQKHAYTRAFGHIWHQSRNTTPDDDDDAVSLSCCSSVIGPFSDSNFCCFALLRPDLIGFSRLPPFLRPVLRLVLLPRAAAVLLLRRCLDSMRLRSAIAANQISGVDRAFKQMHSTWKIAMHSALKSYMSSSNLTGAD